MGAFSYDPTTDRGQVRFLIADTRAENAYYDDAEIDAALSIQGSVEGAVYHLASHALTHALRHTSSRTDSKGAESRTIDDTHTVEGWQALVDMYRPFANATKRLPLVRPFVSRLPSDRSSDPS